MADGNTIELELSTGRTAAEVQSVVDQLAALSRETSLAAESYGLLEASEARAARAIETSTETVKAAITGYETVEEAQARATRESAAAARSLAEAERDAAVVVRELGITSNISAQRVAALTDAERAEANALQLLGIEIGEAAAAQTRLGATASAAAGHRSLGGQGILGASYAIQDFTSVLSGGQGLGRALGAVQNNVPMLVTALGYGAGLAGAVSIVSVGIGLLVDSWDGIKSLWDDGSTERETARMARLADETERAAKAQARANEAARAKFRDTTSPEQDERKKYQIEQFRTAVGGRQAEFAEAVADALRKEEYINLRNEDMAMPAPANQTRAQSLRARELRRLLIQHQNGTTGPRFRAQAEAMLGRAAGGDENALRRAAELLPAGELQFELARGLKFDDHQRRDAELRRGKALAQRREKESRESAARDRKQAAQTKKDEAEAERAAKEAAREARARRRAGAREQAERIEEGRRGIAMAFGAKGGVMRGAGAPKTEAELRREIDQTGEVMESLSVAGAKRGSVTNRERDEARRALEQQRRLARNQQMTSQNMIALQAQQERMARAVKRQQEAIRQRAEGLAAGGWPF